MATTEITKILFRRGSSDDRFDLEALGGLAQGEPGFTSSGGGTVNQFYNQSSAFLHQDDATQHAVGDGVNGTNGGSTRAGGGDFFVGGGGTADIFIGGTSAERHWQRYFVSKYGTSFNHPDAYVDGSFVIGESGRTSNGTRAQNRENHRWDVEFWGEDGDSVQWDCRTGQFNVISNTALAIPAGTTAQQPAAGANQALGTRRLGHIRWNTTTGKFEGWNGNHWGSLARPEDANQDTFVRAESTYGANNDQVEIFTAGTNRVTVDSLSANFEVDMIVNTTGFLEVPNGTTAQRPATERQGMVRYNTTDQTFEGYDGANWGSLGGVSDVTNQTYITVRQAQPAWSNGSQAGSFPAGENTRGETGMIKFVVGRDVNGTTTATVAGGFDNDRNFYVRQDIVAFQTSDSRQKDNIQLISNATDKVKLLKGVEFDWNELKPAWVQEDNIHDVGLIAQDVKEVIPEAVVTRDNGLMAVDYTRVVPLLVEAIKDLTDRVNHLESLNDQ